jgi:hypothetical protein
MHKLAALALTSVLGIAATGYTKPAEARVYVGVGIGLPGVALVAPPVYASPPAVGVYAPYYYYGRPFSYGPRYYGPGFARYGYGLHGGYGFHGYGHAYGHR